MGNPSSLMEAYYEVESMPGGTLGENVSTVATYKLNLRAPVDCSGIEQKKIAMGQVSAYRGDPGDWILGTFEPTWKTKLAIPGHGSTTAGAVTITAFETLLGLIFGNVAMIATGSTLTGAGTANAPTTTDSGTLLPGQIVPIGTLGDGKGEGQFYPVVTHTATTLTLGVDLRATPGAGNARYAGAMVYPHSDGTNSDITGIRMAITSTNAQYLMHGAFPTAVSISGFNPQEVPMIEVTWKAAWFEYKTALTAPAGDSFNPAATAAGSFVVNTVGTSTNTASTRRIYRDLTVDIDIGTIEGRGPGGFNRYQDIINAKRGQDSCKVTWSEYAEATTTTPSLPGMGTSTNRLHGVLTLNTADGTRVGFYWPSLRVMNVPRLIDIGGINGYRIECMAGVGATTTSALTLSKWRMGLS